MITKLSPGKAITVEEGSFQLNHKPFFMYSGEIHYFRIPPSKWKLHLTKARQAGFNTVSSYIPWSWHEYEEGKFDFDGKTHPQRNLIRYLKEVKKAGLYFTARVGPVSNAELVGEGIPAWLLSGHPEIFVQRKGINNLPHAILLSYLNGTFQDYVRKWYEKVLPIVSERQIHEGGNIVMVQLCNEIGMIHWLLKAYDENENVSQMYRAFLREKYQTISALNKAYQTRYLNFDDVEQPKEAVVSSKINIYVDWALFYRKYYALYYKSLAQMARQYSITVPLSANIPQFYDYDIRGRGIYSPMTTSLFRDFSIYTPGIIYGGAYQMRRLDFENFHDVSITTEMVRLLDRNVPSICAELQTGIMRDKPRLYPSDVDLNIKTSVAHGLNGLNCYMFSGGENHSGMGEFGSYHDWQAPLSIDGKEKEHMVPLKNWGKFVRKFGSSIASTEKMVDTSLGFYLPYYATEYTQGAWTNEVEFLRTHLFFDGFARLVQLAGYNFSITDVMRETTESLSSQESLCMFSLDFMDEKTQRKLADYVLQGGKLIIGPRIPSLDLFGQKCEVLSKSLGISFESSAQRRIIWGKTEQKVDSPIQLFSNNDNSPLVTTQDGSSCVVAGKAGKGNWLAYGFGVPHVYDFQVDMVREWFHRLSIFTRLEVNPWDVQAVVRWGKEHGFIFIFNYHDLPKKGILKAHLQSVGVKKDFTVNFKLERRSVQIIPLKFNKKHMLGVIK